MAGFVSPSRLDLVLRTRLSVLTAMSGAVSALLVTGVPPAAASVVAVAGTFGGVEVGCRLTSPYAAPKTVVSVLVVVLVMIVSVVRFGYPLPECLAVVLTAAWCTAELARRATAAVFPLATGTV